MIDIKNPYLIVILGDFNSKLSNWYKCNKTVYEGSENQCYIISLWTITINSRNNPYIIKLVPLHWPNIYISTQSCNEIRSPFFATLKLPSPTSIWSLMVFSTFWTLDMALSTCKCWSSQKINWPVFLENII